MSRHGIEFWLAEDFMLTNVGTLNLILTCELSKFARWCTSAIVTVCSFPALQIPHLILLARSCRGFNILLCVHAYKLSCAHAYTSLVRLMVLYDHAIQDAEIFLLLFAGRAELHGSARAS